MARPSRTPSVASRPHLSRVYPPFFYALNRIVRGNSFYRFLGGRLERHPWWYRLFTQAEKVTKERVFGCRMCGQCALPATGYTCPMACPKQLRNGPCGGVSASGQCEVDPDMRCVWVTAFERAQRSGHGADLDLLHRPMDHRAWGSSSWVNYWQGRDDHLWVSPSQDRPPLLRRELGLVPR